MSLKILPIPAVPEETARIVCACFPSEPSSTHCATRWAPSTATRTSPISSPREGNPPRRQGA
jgi:hypothetical protein